MPSDRRWSDTDRELVERAWRSTSAVRLYGIEMMVSDAMRATDVLDALTTAGWVRMDPAEPHLIEFRDDGWTIQHPVRCRPNLFACTVNRVAGDQVDGPPASGLGVYECDVDDGGVFVLDYSKGGPIDAR